MLVFDHPSLEIHHSLDILAWGKFELGVRCLLDLYYISLGYIFNTVVT